MAALEHSIHQDGARTLVGLRGELDLAGAALLEPELERLAAAPDLETLTLDLRELQFLDSSGLRLVALTDQRLRGAGRRLELVPGNGHVMRVFEITRMVDHLTWVEPPR